MERIKENNQGGENAIGEKSRSLKLSRKGISTGQDFASLMSSLMSDLIEGRITPQVGNAVVNAGGKLLKVVEMQHKYGAQQGERKDLLLTAVS